MTSCNRCQDSGERAYPPRVVIRNGDMVFAMSSAGRPEMAELGG